MQAAEAACVSAGYVSLALEGDLGGGGVAGERADDLTLAEANSSASLRQEMALRDADWPSGPHKSLCVL